IVVAGVTPVPGWPASLAAEPVSNSPRAAASSKALVTSSRWSYHHCALRPRWQVVCVCPPWLHAPFCTRHTWVVRRSSTQRQLPGNDCEELLMSSYLDWWAMKMQGLARLDGTR